MRIVERLALPLDLGGGRALVDAHRGQQLARVGVQRGELGVGEAGHVLDVIGLVRLEQQERLGTVVRQLLLGEEVRVARRDHPFDGEQPRVPVIGVQPVPLPRVVSEHHRGLEPADPVGHLPPLAQPRVELAVGPAEEDALAGGAQRLVPRPAARPAA